MPVYASSPIKRTRRNKAEIAAIKAAIHGVIAEDHPMTVRQTFYRLVASGTIHKTEAEYKGTVCRLLTVMRRDGEIPWGWITDYTRVRRKPKTYGDIEAAIADTAQAYRRSVWRDLGVRVEIWCEKDALAGVLLNEAWQFDVPLMVTRGYPSLSFLHAAGEEIEDSGKPTFIYYFGDHDPSGVHIPVTVQAGLREFAPSAEIHFERVAVLPEQIREMGLPTRPTKKTDSRSKGFTGASVEVDAIPPRALRKLCRGRIMAHIGDDVLRVHRAAEESERGLLRAWADAFRKNV